MTKKEILIESLGGIENVKEYLSESIDIQKEPVFSKTISGITFDFYKCGMNISNVSYKDSPRYYCPQLPPYSDLELPTMLVYSQRIDNVTHGYIRSCVSIDQFIWTYKFLNYYKKIK